MSVVAASCQQVERVFGDARQYRVTALAFTEQRYPIAAEAPFVYRIGTPWLASVINPAVKQVISGPYDALIDTATGLDDVPPFYVINIAAALIFSLLLLRYLRFFIFSAALRLFLLAMWLVQWHAPPRWVYFNPVNVEPLFLVAVVAALIQIELQRDSSTWRAAARLVPLTVLGTLCRESMVLLPLAFIASRKPLEILERRDWHNGAWGMAPLVSAIAALAFTRMIATPTNDYHAWSEPWRMLRDKPLDSWLLAWFFTFGPPAIALLAAAAPELGRFLRTRPDMLVWLAGCAVLGFIGGTDTERILGWAAPVVYVLIGISIASRGRVLLRTPGVIVVLLVLQLLSARLFWPVPQGFEESQPLGLAFNREALYEFADRILVIEHHYSNLWSFFGSRILHLATLAADVVFTGGLALWIRRQPDAIDAVSG